MNMNNLVSHLIIVIVPLIFSNTLHMLVVKKNLFNYLNKSISVALFGKNKTWRGLIFVSICNAFLLMFINEIFQFKITHPFYLGLILGVSYIVFELPNSYMKRKLGIQPGEQHEKHKILFALIDKMDSAFGITIIYWVLGYINIQNAIILFLCGSLTHILISKILVLTKIKKAF